MDNFQRKDQRLRLGEILIREGVITREQLDGALRWQNQNPKARKRIGEILISRGVITEKHLAEALSVQLGLQFYSLSNLYSEPEAICLIPHSTAKRLKLVPLSLRGERELFIVMSDPLDLAALDEVQMLSGCKLRIGVVTQEDIRENIDRLYSFHDNLEGAITDAANRQGILQWSRDDASVSGDAPMIQLVNGIIQQAIQEGASDIHLEVQEGRGCVRFRVDGLLCTVSDYPSWLQGAMVSRLKIMGGMDIAEKRMPQDGRIWVNDEGRRIDLRVSTLPTINGEKVELRILDRKRALMGMDRLGLEADDREKLEVFCGIPWGILLVTGPTGSGKSTTLYAILQRINNPKINIVTVEDPVEYSIAGINQVQISEKTGLTFGHVLRSILRQDPDKIMVGEIRDQETAQIAIRAALTGHFVFSTLHTNDAPSAVTRIIDMGIPPFMAAASLTGVIAQRLVRCLCPHCREEYELDARTCELNGIPVGTHAFRPRGCSECRSGYRGRRGIYEIMVMDDVLRRMILDGAGVTALRQTAIQRGMKTLRRSGINAVLAGITSMEEVLSATL
ncbi:MAG: GspE/PulE family protein [Fretibacterium sp.]|nr:GspE/PulE family protein [Fretibacterium sp.]